MLYFSHLPQKVPDKRFSPIGRPKITGFFSKIHPTHLFPYPYSLSYTRKKHKKGDFIVFRFYHVIASCALIACILPTVVVHAASHTSPNKPVFPSVFLGVPKGYHFNSAVWDDLTQKRNSMRYRDQHGIYFNQFPNLPIGLSGFLIVHKGHSWDFESVPSMVNDKGRFEFLFTKPHAASMLYISRIFKVPADGSAIRVPISINKKGQIGFPHWQHKSLAARLLPSFLHAFHTFQY